MKRLPAGWLTAMWFSFSLQLPASSWKHNPAGWAGIPVFTVQPPASMRCLPAGWGGSPDIPYPGIRLYQAPAHRLGWLSRDCSPACGWVPACRVGWCSSDQCHCAASSCDEVTTGWAGRPHIAIQNKTLKQVPVCREDWRLRVRCPGLAPQEAHVPAPLAAQQRL